MLRILLGSTFAFGILLALPLASPAGSAALAFELKSTTVDLPDGDRTFPPGPGADRVSAQRRRQAIPMPRAEIFSSFVPRIACV